MSLLDNIKYSNVYLCLGSNLDDRVNNIHRAVNQLDTIFHIRVNEISPFYLTEPLYFKDQPDFINCIVKISTDLEPIDLLNVCLNIEKIMGRIRYIKNGPRLIDIDIIFFEDKIINLPRLRIPHPKYNERKFVLLPMSDIAPQFYCPVFGITITELLNNCSDNTKIYPCNQVELT